MSSFWTNLFSRRKENPVAGVTLAVAGGRPVRSAINVEAFAKEAYQGNPDVYSAIETLASAAGSIDWKVEKRVRGKWEALDSHEALDLWNRPNPKQRSSTSFVADLVRWRCIAGEWFVGRNEAPAGKPKELWILHPARIAVIPGSSPLEMVSHYMYEQGAGKKHLDAENVLHQALFNPMDDWRGQSPLLAAAALVDQATAAAEFNLGLLQNGGIPPLFLTHEGSLTDVQFAAFKKEMHEGWGSAKAAGLPQLLEGGMDVKTAGSNPKDMQMLEAQRMFALKFAQVIRVPAEFLSGAEEKKYANYGEAVKALYTEGAIPIVKEIRDAVNGWLLPMFGPDVRLVPDLDGIEALQENENALWERVGAADWLTTNEKREATSHEKIGPEGDTILVPFSLTPLGATVVTDETQDDDVTEALQGEKSKALNLPDSAKAEYWKLVDTQRGRVLSQTQKSITTRLEAEHAAIMKAIASAPTEPALLARMERAVDAGKADWAVALKDVALKVAEPFALQTTRELTGSEKSKAVDGWQAFVLRYVKKATAAKVTSITATTKSEIQRIVATASAEGLSVPEIAKRVDELNLSTVINRRSDVIARTEIVQASNAGSIGAAQATGLDLEKEWIGTGDARTRDGHDDVESVPLDEPFNVNGEALDFPGSFEGSPENVIQCRCTVGYTTVGEKAAPVVENTKLQEAVDALSADVAKLLAVEPPSPTPLPEPLQLTIHNHPAKTNTGAVVKRDANGVVRVEYQQEDEA